jgi:acyl carrier protein
MEANTTVSTIDEVKAVLIETLGLQDRADTIDPATPLIGSLPELDSLAVVELVVALEDSCGITIDGEDVTAEAFETVASLAALVERQRS